MTYKQYLQTRADSFAESIRKTLNKYFPDVNEILLDIIATDITATHVEYEGELTRYLLDDVIAMFGKKENED